MASTRSQTFPTVVFHSDTEDEESSSDEAEEQELEEDDDEEEEAPIIISEIEDSYLKKKNKANGKSPITISLKKVCKVSSFLL